MSEVFQLEPAKMAEIVINGEAFVQKAKNVVDHIQTRTSELQGGSDQLDKAKAELTKVNDDIVDNITKKMANVTGVIEDMRVQLESLENSDEIFAAARASQTESSSVGEVQLSQ